MKNIIGLLLATVANAQSTCENSCSLACIKSCRADWYGFLIPTTAIDFCKWWYECPTNFDVDASTEESV